MNFLDELLLSFFTILFILLITKLASASTSASASASASAANSGDRPKLGDSLKVDDRSVDSEPLRSKKKEKNIEPKGDELPAEVDDYLQVEKVDFDFVESDALIENYVSEFDEKEEDIEKDCKFGKVDIESSKIELQSDGFRDEDVLVNELEPEHDKIDETDAKVGIFKLQEIEIKEDEDVVIEFDDESGKHNFEIEHDTSGENVFQLSTFDVVGKLAVQEIDNELNENKFASSVLDEHSKVDENVSEEKINEDKIAINEFDSTTQIVKDDNMEEEVNVAELDVKASKNDNELNEKKESKEEEKSSIDESKKSLLQGEDEWEGIEKTEVEKLFSVAVEFVSSEYGGNALEKVGGDVMKQLNGLHKIATEGPFYGPQSLALKVAARAKWHPWQKPGSISPDAAMEQYIAILTANVPGWMVEKPNIEARQEIYHNTPDVETSRTHDSSKLHSHLTSSEIPGDDPPCDEAVKSNIGPTLFEKGLTSTFVFDLLSPSRVSFLTLCW